jgi:hypothetical protein
LKKENMQTNKKRKEKRTVQSKRVKYSLKEKNKGKRMPEKKISAFRGGGGESFLKGGTREIYLRTENIWGLLVTMSD